MRNAGYRRHHLHAPDREASRQSHTQRIAATISATQLRLIGIVYVPTVIWAWLIKRRTCPMAKIAKMTLATRNPVLGEFISRLLKLRGELSARYARSISHFCGTMPPARICLRLRDRRTKALNQSAAAQWRFGSSTRRQRTRQRLVPNQTPPAAESPR
jgi:hypothetical protein